jgi:hypothetical protein
MVLSPLDVVRLAKSVGYHFGGGIDIAVAVAFAESRFDTNALLVNKENVGLHPGDKGYGSHDRGLWQINDFWHPEVTDGQAFDAEANAAAAFRISRGGTNWSPWSTFNSGAFKTYMPLAQTARALDDALTNVSALTAAKNDLSTQLAAMNDRLAAVTNDRDIFHTALLTADATIKEAIG